MQAKSIQFNCSKQSHSNPIIIHFVKVQFSVTVFNKMLYYLKVVELRETIDHIKSSHHFSPPS